MAAVDPIEREKYAGVAEKPETEWKTGTNEKWLVDRTHQWLKCLAGRGLVAAGGRFGYDL